MHEPDNIQEMKRILEAALLTTPQPLSLDDLLKLFAGRMERATLRMLLDELKVDWLDKTLDLVQVASGYRFQAKADLRQAAVDLGQGLVRLQEWLKLPSQGLR